MEYAKLINGFPAYAPNPIKHGGLWYGNPPGSVYEAEGYKPVHYTDPPKTQPGFVAVPGWEENDAEIVQTWTVEQDSGEIDDSEALNIILGGSE